MAKDNTKALAAFIARKSQIDGLLARIQGISGDHFGRAPETVNWGDVGSLGEVAEKLREIAAFLNPGDNDPEH